LPWRESGIPKENACPAIWLRSQRPLHVQGDAGHPR
jgi:hypothetical protein